MVVIKTDLSSLSAFTVSASYLTSLSQNAIGAQGYQGLIGTQGGDGVQGQSGLQGPKGASADLVGTQGPSGNQGFQGSIGQEGLRGTQGVVGCSGVNTTPQTTGPQGLQGVFTGSTGPRGFQSNPGFQSSAVGVQGFQGFQGIANFRGFQGVQGNSGVLGYQQTVTEDATTIVLRLLGANIVSTPVVSYHVPNITSTKNMISTLYMGSTVYIPTTTTITGVTWYQGTQGVYTSSNTNGIALYSYNVASGTITLQASYTSGSIWTAGSNTWNSVSFASSYSASPGTYFIMTLYSASSATTTPSIGVVSTGLSDDGTRTQFFFTNSVRAGLVGKNATTSFGSTIDVTPSSTAINGGTWYPFFAVY